MRKQYIMLIDDEEEIRTTLGSILKATLSDLNAEIIIQSNAEEALDTLGSIPIDLILTDILMPGMTGLEMIDSIRSRGNKIRIIAITGSSARDEYEVELLLAESNTILDNTSKFKATEILYKPINTMELVSNLKEFLLENAKKSDK